jgi:Flp pilus assembly protein TadD
VLTADINAAYELIGRGALGDAEAICQRALAASRGRDPQAWTTLGVVLREQQRERESEAAYRQAILLAPTSVAAHHNLGALLSQLERAEEALVALDRASTLGLKARELHINRGRALMQLYRMDEAERAYAAAVALEPRDPEAQKNLAQLRYMRGDPEFARDFAAAARESPADLRLQLSYADLLRRADDLPGAEALLRDLLRQFGPVPQARAALSSVLHAAGRLREAEAQALEAAAAQPHDIALIENLVSVELAVGRPEQAMPFIRAQRQRLPNDQRWIAYEATAARQLGHSFYAQLYDYGRLVQVYELEAPAGWRSIEELNAALVETLRARHRFATHPLDQSLRNGSQTARSLVTERDTVIQALLSAFAAPLESYRATLGNAPDHPLSARNSGTALLRGCWSVELRRNGYHVNHVHPQGWISSAYYVSVPSEVADTSARSGWIKFGEPGMPIPSLGAEHFVQPRAGRLVLFPSYMWHGTNTILGNEPRLTVAFDAVPGSGAPLT